MQYEETYQGQRIIITTAQRAAGGWEAQAQLPDAGKTISLERGSENVYPTEEEARRAARSAAAEAIDRSRITRGKP